MDPVVRTFLESVPIGVLATVRPDGRVRQTAVYFVLDRSTVWMSTEASRAKAADVARTGWASLCVVGPAAPYPSATVEGPGAVQEEEVAPLTARIAARMTGGEPPELAEADLVAAGRVLVRLDVERVYGVAHLPAAGGES